jgi:hypothetical protein
MTGLLKINRLRFIFNNVYYFIIKPVSTDLNYNSLSEQQKTTFCVIANQSR